MEEDVYEVFSVDRPKNAFNEETRMVTSPWFNEGRREYACSVYSSSAGAWRDWLEKLSLVERFVFFKGVGHLLLYDDWDASSDSYGIRDEELLAAGGR